VKRRIWKTPATALAKTGENRLVEWLINSWVEVSIPGGFEELWRALKSFGCFLENGHKKLY